MQKINCITIGNFTLTKSNLANTCEHEDSEILYPLTVTDQVMVNESTSLTSWINNLHIPSDTNIPYYYNTGIKIATINDTDLYIPYLRTVNNVLFDGVPNFDWNYFKLGTQDNKDKIQFDLSFVSNYDSDLLSIGSIKNIGNTTLAEVTIPKTLLDISYDSTNERIQLDVNTGNFTNSAYISKSLIQSVAPSNTYTLSNGADNTIVLSDGTTESTATYQTYTASKGVTIVSNDIQHVNNITAGSIIANITSDGKLRIPTVSYDVNGHITSQTNNDLTIPTPVDTTSLWLSNTLVTNYFRIPKTWVSEASYTDSTHFKYYYVPLFKVIPLTGAGGLFRANILFEVVSRMDFNYYGKYLLNYSIPLDQYSQSLLQITKAPTVEGDIQRLNLEAYVKSELIDNISTLVITVYRKITTPVNNSKSSITADTFFTSVLGYNNPDLSTPQNSYEFYTFNGDSGDSRPSSILEITYENKDDLGTYIPLVY